MDFYTHFGKDGPMFAVIKTGGKQYKVAEGDIITIEKLDIDAGDAVTFEDVLMLGEGESVDIGAPFLSGAKVMGEIVRQAKGEKKLIMKKRQRSTYRRKKGHRQQETTVVITGISADGKAAPKKKAAAAKPKAAPKATATPAPQAETDSRGRLTEAVGGKADDLKLIKGVGKVLEGKLNEAGVFHFWQVANLKADQIEELENDMSFPGRIGRDNWLEQAAEFAKDA